MEAYIVKRAKMVREIAFRHGWEYIGCNEENFMVSFTQEGKRINVWLTTLTVATAMNHPTKGKTQLYRKDLSYHQLEKVFGNPRVHTKKGYYKKPK